MALDREQNIGQVPAWKSLQSNVLIQQSITTERGEWDGTGLQGEAMWSDGYSSMLGLVPECHAQRPSVASLRAEL